MHAPSITLTAPLPSTITSSPQGANAQAFSTPLYALLSTFAMMTSGMDISPFPNGYRYNVAAVLGISLVGTDAGWRRLYKTGTV